MKLKTQKESWKKWGQYEVYKIFTCPGRPSREDIKNFNKLVSESLRYKKNPQLLVLGSTPEIRDMLLKFSLLLGARVTCVDMSKDMFETMNRFKENNNGRNETFVKSNWATMKFNMKFDVIIGDYTGCNVDMKFKDQYFRNISSLLKRDGHFICREVVISKKHRFKKVDELFKEYIEKIKTEEVTMKQFPNWVANEMLISSWFVNNGTRKTSLKFIEEDILDYGRELKRKSSKHGNNLLLREMYNRFMVFFGVAKEKYWTPLTKEDNDRNLKKYFKIKKIIYSDDYAESLIYYSPIYMLSKK